MIFEESTSENQGWEVLDDFNHDLNCHDQNPMPQTYVKKSNTAFFEKVKCE